MDVISKKKEKRMAENNSFDRAFANSLPEGGGGGSGTLNIKEVTGIAVKAFRALRGVVMERNLSQQDTFNVLNSVVILIDAAKEEIIKSN